MPVFEYSLLAIKVLLHVIFSLDEKLSYDGILLIAFYGVQFTIQLRAPANKSSCFKCEFTTLFAYPCCIALDSDTKIKPTINK
jgi:hypothetical protein